MMDLALDQPLVAIIAGEASGDLHGSKLVRAMQSRHPGLVFVGIGGPALRLSGVRILMDASELAVVGITEVFSKLPRIFRGMGIIKKLLKSVRPDLLILIDFPDFNLHVAAVAKKLGIPVLYYISPQVWAWRPGRVKRIGRLVDRMAVILPFEERFYQQHQVPVTYVGHPLLDERLPPPEHLLQKKSAGPPVIGLLPGSRDKEINNHLPVMLDAANILKERVKHATFVISHAPAVKRGQIEAIVRAHRFQVDATILSGGVESVFEHSDVVVAASGTVTLQAAIYGMPMVIIYKVSPLSYWLGRALVKVQNIGLVNLVAGREIVPELIQHDASALNISTALSDMLGDTERRYRLKRELLELREVLGEGGASDRVARIALEMLQRSS